MAKLQKFDGGINVRDASHLIAVNEGVVADSIDIEEGILQPINKCSQEILSLTDNARYIEYAGAIVTLAKTPHTFVEYQDKTYYSVLGDHIQVKDDTTEGDLGVITPTMLSVTLSSSRPAAPVIGDFTFSQEEDTATFPTSWVSGETKEFAFVRVNDEGAESLPFLHNLTISSFSSGYSKLNVSLPYKWRVYLKRAGKWGKYGSISLVSPSSYAPMYTTFTASTVHTVHSSVWIGLIAFYGDHDVAAMQTGIAFTDNISYVATAYISALDWESAPSSIIEVAPDSGGADLATIRVGLSNLDSRVDKINLYRLGGTITDFTLVDSYDYTSGVLTITDGALTSSISGNSILASENNTKMFAGATNLIVSNGQLVCTYGTKLYFSEPGKLHAIPAANYRDFKDTLTGAVQIDAGLLVFSARKTWLLNTSNLATGKIIRLSDEFGCSGHETIVGLRTGAMWASLAGVCSSNGGRVELLTKHKIGYLDLNITRAKMHNEVYFGFSDDGDCYALDMRYELVPLTHSFSALLSYSATSEVRQVYEEGADLKFLFGTPTDVHSLTVFGSAEKETFTWKSPKYLDGAYTERKTYNEIYVRATNNITFFTYIDDTLVDTTVFTKTDTHTVRVPQEHHQGYSIQFKVQGTGMLYEIEYKAMGRQNGR